MLLAVSADEKSHSLVLICYLLVSVEVLSVLFEFTSKRVLGLLRLVCRCEHSLCLRLPAVRVIGSLDAGLRLLLLLGKLEVFHPSIELGEELLCRC